MKKTEGLRATLRPKQPAILRMGTPELHAANVVLPAATALDTVVRSLAPASPPLRTTGITNVAMGAGHRHLFRSAC
jgi:hypothetical protein